ncbi:MAG: hypothetical protein R3B70_36355 [Polyangiaceae bacterium]
MRRALLGLSIAVATLSLGPGVVGCGKSDKDVVAEAVSAESSVTERFEGGGDVTWNVAPDGHVSARVRDKDEIVLQQGVSAKVTVAGAAPVTVPLTLDPATGLLTGQLPKLTDDLTALDYEVQAGDKKLTGTLHVPRGGTKELVESAREAAAARSLPPDTKGPHGGIVQVVGDDIVEVAADKDSGAVRMYILDDDLKPIPVGKRKGKLGLAGTQAEVVELSAEPNGMYLTGKAAVKANPAKVTVVVIDGDEVDVAICHYVPGAVIVVGPAAPVVAVFVVTGWPVVVVPGVVVVQPGVIVKKGKGKGKFKVKVW